MSTTTTSAPTLPDPQTLRDLKKLCLTHPEVMVTRADALAVGNCEGDTDRFIAKYLHGHTEVPLSELVPFISSYHDYWGEVVDTIIGTLYKLAIISSNWQSERWESIKSPKRKRLIDLSDVELPGEESENGADDPPQ